jgi:hypothetical protein
MNKGWDVGWLAQWDNDLKYIAATNILPGQLQGVSGVLDLEQPR